ncbi:MAG: metallophosphoesterase [Candidatus Hodarchaeota archaeon]
MKLAITSDIHFPPEITSKTILFTRCGYLDDFYIELKKEIQFFSPRDIDAFIVCGDFFWDYRYFIHIPYVPPDWGFYNAPILMLREFRKDLHEQIPLIMIEGNHDYWFQRYIHSHDGNGFLDIGDYKRFLKDYFGLDEKQAQNTVDLLGGDVKIGNNMFLLKNEGMLVKDVLVYGLNFYNKEESTVPWPEIKKELTQKYFGTIESFLRTQDVDIPLKVVLCQHEHPTDSTLVESFSHPSCEVKVFFWGHNHTVSDAFIERLSRRGPYRCVMPEKNDFKIIIKEI